jgi:plasmid stabilization system protein ParE
VNIRFLKPAEAELDDAIEYYESEQLGLGTRLRNEVLRSLARIAKHPVAYQVLSNRTRRCLIAKFPYGIIYQHSTETDEILVIAIAHLHRKPDYWSSRNS